MRKCNYLITIMALACFPALAGPITVYTGYADNIRPSGFFPSLWLGDPSVVSQTAPGQSLDAGAIRIDNSSGAPVTISNMTVTFGGGQTHNFWTSLVIPGGGTGIFTQSVPFNFDTSDFGLFGAGPVNVDASHPLGGCTNPANAAQVTQCAAYQPIITFDLNGVPQSFTDTGHILDTFGYDLINLGAPGGDGNESIDWNLIGSTPTRGGVPEPATLFLVLPALAGMRLAHRRLRQI